MNDRPIRLSCPLFVSSGVRTIFFAVMCFCLQLISTASIAQGWKWGVGSSCKMGYFESGPITIDKSGNAYEVGKYSYHFSLDSLISIFGPDTVIDSAGIGLQAIVVSADSNGAYRWALGVQYGDATFTGLKADKYGNVYLIGSSNGYFRLGAKSCSDTNFIAKVNTIGNVVWIKPFTPNKLQFDAISIDSNGNPYVTGLFWGKTFTMGSTVLTNTDTSGVTADVFYAKLDSLGNVLWASSFGGTSADQVAAIEVTNDSIIYIAGIFASDSMKIGHNTLFASPGNPQFYVARFKANAPVWGKTINASYCSYFSLNAITTDGKDNLYITGQYGNQFIFAGDTLSVPFTFGNIGGMYLVKYDPSGNEKWARSQPSVSLLSYGFSVAADGCMVWVSGGPFGVGTDDRMFLAKYDTAGRFVDTIVLPAGGDDANAIVTDHKGNLYVGGDYYYPFEIDSSRLALTDSPQEALFILKYGYGPEPCAFEETEPVNKIAANCMLFPNPVTSDLNIESPDVIQDVAIISIMGTVVYSKHTPVKNEREMVLEVANLPNGIYLVKVNGLYVGKIEKE